MFTLGTLSKRTVHIGIGNGNYVEVPMLSVGDCDIVFKMQSKLISVRDDSSISEGDKIGILMKARNELADVACKVMPEELHENVRRLEILALMKLVNVLCTGDDNSEEDSPEKKTVFASQL